MTPSEWPSQWKTYTRRERSYEVVLGCGCSTEFGEPLPPVGSTIICRTHGEVQVASTDDPPRCTAKNQSGERCRHTPPPGETMCKAHRAS